MNDALYELIVARKPKPYDLAVRILVILLIAAAGGAAFYAHLLHRRNGGQGHDE